MLVMHERNKILQLNVIKFMFRSYSIVSGTELNLHALMLIIQYMFLTHSHRCHIHS